MCITQVQIYDYTHSCGHKCGSDTLQSIAPYPIALARRESSSDQSFSCSDCPEIIYTYPVDPCEGCKRHGRWIWDFDVYDFVQVAVEDLSVGVGGADMDVEYVEDNLPSWNTMQEPSSTTAIFPHPTASNIDVALHPHAPHPASPRRNHEDILVAAMSGVCIGHSASKKAGPRSAALPRGGVYAAPRTIARRRREAKAHTRTLTVSAQTTEDLGVLRARRAAVKKRKKS